MADKNGSSKSSSPIKAWMKVAAGSTKSAFKTYMSESVMPTTASMVSDINSIRKEAAEKHKSERPRKQTEIFKKIMQSPMAKNAKKFLSDGWKEVKRGNIFMIGANGFDESEDDFSLDGDESTGGSTMFNEGSANAEMMSGYDEIGDRISDQTEATYKAAEATMNATIVSSSAVIESQEKIGANIVSRLDAINASMASISKTQTDMMDKFFRAVTDSLDKMGVAVKEEETQSAIPTEEDLFKRGKTGKAAGVNLKAYKTRIVNNIKTVATGGGSGTGGFVVQAARAILDQGGPEAVMSMFSTLLMSKVFENNIGKLGNKIESVVADGIPRVLMGFTDMGNNPASNKFAQTIGKILGVDLTPKTMKPDVKFEGKGIPFDDQTKASIVNVIPKHLSEISEYTRLLAKTVANLDEAAMDRVAGKAKTFDMEDGHYKSREDLTKELFDNYYNQFFNEIRSSELGRGLQAVADKRMSYINADNDAGVKARQEIQESYDSVMKQIAMYIYSKNNEAVNLTDRNRLEELGNVFANNGATSDQIQQLLDEVKMIASRASVVDDMASLRLGIHSAGNSARSYIDKNPNLVDTLLTDPRYANMDMVEIMPHLIGKGPNVYKATGYTRNRATNTNTQTQNRPDASPAGGFNPAQSAPSHGDRGNQSDQSAADNAHLNGGNSNPENEVVKFNNIRQAEDSAVNELLGSSESFSDRPSHGDRLTERFNRIGDRGRDLVSRIGAKVSGKSQELLDAISHGNIEGAFNTLLGGMAAGAVLTGKFVGKTVLSPVTNLIFGKKGDEGYREGGMLSGVSNKIHDMMQSVAARIDGKDWTDQNGNVHKADDPNESIFAKAKATITNAAKRFKKIFTGDENDRQANSDDGESVVDSIKSSSKDLFSSAKRNFEQLLYGDDYADLDEEGKKARIAKVKDDIKKRVGDGLKGGLIGGGVSMALGTTALPSILSKVTLGGLLGNGVLATAVLNPIVGAGIGFTAGFLSKSESFQRFFFGGEYTDKNGNTQWREGLVSKKVQDYFSKNKKTIGISGAIGAGAAVLSGAKLGWLGSILGGPLAGASIGITTSLMAKSDAFHTFIFGDEEKGITGIKQQWAKLTEGMFKNGPSMTREGIKTAGFAGVGALVGRAFGPAMLKAGLLPQLFGTGGPIGLSMIGMAGGLMLAHKNLNKFLFGEDVVNKNGEIERKEGLIGKFTNALKVTLIHPVANVGKSLVRSINYHIKHDVFAPLRVAFYPVANFAKKLMSRITKTVSGFGKKIGKGIDKYLLNPMKMLVRAITRPLANAVKLAGSAIKGGLSVSGKLFSTAVNGAGKLASLGMTPEEKAQWEDQKKKAKDEKKSDRAQLRRDNKADKLANKDRNTILKYTGGDYGDDTAEARRVAEARAGFKIKWKNATPKDGWYTGDANADKNTFKQSNTILGSISNTAKSILSWLQSKAVRRQDEPTVGHAAGIDKVPEGQDYVANENSTLGRREAIQIPKANGKGSILVEGRTGSFVVHNGGGETVYNGSEQQPIPILVTAYSDTAMAQRNGAEVKVTEVSDEVNADIVDDIDESDDKTISDKIKDYSNVFGKSLFGPDWEPKKGGLYDILTSVAGDTIGAVITPFIGAAKVIAGVAKGAFSVLKIGWNIVKAPFKLGAWAGKKAFEGGKKAYDFIKDRATRTDGRLDIGATISNVVDDAYMKGVDKIEEVGNTMAHNRKYAKIKRLIESGNSFYTKKFSLYKDEDGREHIVAKEDVELDGGITVQKGQELKDALGAANIFKRTEAHLADNAKARLEALNKQKQEEENKENDGKAKPTDANPAITSSLAPTNDLLSKILSAAEGIRDSIGDQSKLATDTTSVLNPIAKPSEAELDGKASVEEGSAKFVQAKAAESEATAEIQNREDENNESLKQLVENSEDEKETRKSWFGSKGKLVKILGIGALALLALYKFIGGKGLKGLLTNLGGALLGSVKQTVGDVGYGLDNLTDQKDLISNIKDMDVKTAITDSRGGSNIFRRLRTSLSNAIGVASKDGLKAGGKSLVDDAKRTSNYLKHWKNPFVQADSAKNSAISTSAAAFKDKLTKVSTKLTDYVSVAENNGVKTVSEAFTTFVQSIAKKAGGEAGEAAAQSAAKSSVFKDLLSAIKLKAAKIMAKVSGSKFAKGVAAVVSFGLSEAGFAVIGAVNGATGAAKLFHVDKEDVDPLMVAISSAMGAFTSTLIGSIMDAASSVVAEATGLDLLCEVASLVYRIIGDGTKLDTARDKFREGYEDYKDEELKKQYQTFMAVNSSTVGSDYTYEDFVADVESGKKGAKLDSEITYNKKKNKSILDKIGDKTSGIIRGAKSLTKDVGEGIFGNTETVYVDNDNETIYRRQGQQWFAYKWTGKILVSVGLVDEKNIPDSAIAVKCHINSWFDSGTDEVNDLPKRYGWSAWRPGEVTDSNGNIITNEVDVTGEENNKDKEKNEAYDTSGPTATLADETDVPYFLQDSQAKFEDMSDPNNNGEASWATIMRDKEMSDVFGKSFTDAVDSGKDPSEMIQMFREGNPDYDFRQTLDGGISVDDAMAASAKMESNDEFREFLKDYALYIRDWDTGDTGKDAYNAGFFLVHPNENSFIRFTAAGQLFGTGYKWTSVLSAWITGNLISKKITNYDDLISSLTADGVDIATVDPAEIKSEDESEESGSIFDMLGKAFSSLFSAFNNSWRRIMTGEEVDESMEAVEEQWVDKVYGKRIIRPISSDGSKPTKKGFKAASYLFYVLDGSKKFFKEYNIFQLYTGSDIPVAVVKNWVKASEAWIDFSDKGTVNYDDNGAPDIQPIDAKDIQIYQVGERSDGLLGLQAELADGDYTAAQRVAMAENAKGSFEGYRQYVPQSTNASIAPTIKGSNGKEITLDDNSGKNLLIDTILSTFKGSDTEKYQQLFDLLKTGITGASLIKTIETKDQLLDILKDVSYKDILNLVKDKVDLSSLNKPNQTSPKGGFGLSSKAFSNKQREELDRRFANIKAAAQVSNANAKTMSQLVSAEDSTTSEIYNAFRSKNREESVRKQFSDMLSPTQVLMGMDGTYWVWDSVNTFHRYTYFGQDIAEELSNDEMMALYKNGRYLVEERPISSISRLQSTLSSNLTTISSNFNTGLNSVSNGINYVSSYVSNESTGNNIYTTGSSSSTIDTSGSTSSSSAESSKTSSIWDSIKQSATDIANKISAAVGKKTSTEDVTKKTPIIKNSNIKRTSKTTKTSKGGFGDRLNGVPYYSQNDSRWKNSDYSGANDSATMGDAGCGPTVLSMVDNYFGGHETPTDYARLAQDSGYRDETGTNWDFIGDATRSMGLNTNQVENPDSLDIVDQLSTGQPVILSGTRTMSPSESPYTKAGHYVVATGLNSNGTVNISDPRGRSYSKAFPLDKLASDTGSMWGFGGRGGFGKAKKEILKRLKRRGGGRGTFNADAARKIMLKWISAFYQRVHYANVDASNMDAAYAGTGIGQADCSSLQQYLYRRAAGIEINRDTRSQACNKYPVIDRSNGDNYAVPNWSALKPGDLIYFCRLGSDINNPANCMCHVEMYIGNTHSLGIGSPSTPGSRLMDVQSYITNGSAATCGTPQKYWGTKRIIQDGQTYDMNVPDESLIRFNTDTYSAVQGSGGGSSSTDSSTSSATVSGSTSAKTKDFFEVFSSLMGEVGNRYAKGVSTGNFDTDFSAAFDEILNGGNQNLSSGGSSSSLGSFTANTGGSYANGGIYNGDYIGAYVKKFESGSKGSESYGQCGNDWGRSWGSYSLTHHWGNAIRFLKTYYPDLAANLRYTQPSPDIYSKTWNSTLAQYASSPDEVSAVWNAALAKDGKQNFFANEHQYIADNFYKPALDFLPVGGTQFNPDTHSRAAQELIWSWAVARGGECVGRKEFPATGVRDNNVSVPDLLSKSYAVRIAKTSGYDPGTRYRNTGNSGNSEYSQLLEIANLQPFKMPSKTMSSKPTVSGKKKKTSDGKTIKATTVDESAKGGFGDKITKSTLKKEVKALSNKKGKAYHVTDPKTKQANLQQLSNIEAKVNSYEPIEGDIAVSNNAAVSYNNTIPGSNGVKQSDVRTGKGGYGEHINRSSSTTATGSTVERALNKLVELVEAIVEYASQSTNKLDYLKDIKNQQVVVKEGDKNVAVATNGNSNSTDSTMNKSIGRFLAEILASG